VAVPTEQGLGVELDKIALAKLHQNYLDYRLIKCDNLVEMRKFVPNWEFLQTRQ